MIDGNYSAQMSASTYMRNSMGYTRVCIEIVGTGSSATTKIKARPHGGNWERLDGSVVTLTLYDGGGTDPEDGPENCGHQQRQANQPTNFCGANRYFNAQGWNGHLTWTNKLRIRVNNHIMKMQGERTMTHGSGCP